MDKKVKYWIDTAEYDLDTAQAMLDTGRYLYVGFLCHQTIEKCLKAVIAKGGLFPPKIHNLLNLAEKANIIENIKKNILKRGRDMKKFILVIVIGAVNL